MSPRRCGPRALKAPHEEHLEQGILVSRGEQDAGAEQAVGEIAATTERTRTAQLALLDGAGR